MTRRELLRLLGSGAVALAAPGCSTSPPLKTSRTAPLMDAEPWGGLATSLAEERAYVPRVEGKVPEGLRGTLYRNGPGLFDRGGRRRRALLDGDGLVQAFRFGEEGVFYRARFVGTEKFVAEEGDELVLDFVGYEDPDHFIGEDPLVTAVMKGRPGRFEYPGLVRRIRVAPGTARARNEVVAGGSFEWPRIDDRLLGRPNRWGYVASARPKRFFWNAVARVDFEDGSTVEHDFGDRVFASEPVFVPDPARAGEEGGWLLVELYDGDARRSSLAILDAARIADGPVARVLLEHHVPVSFYGYWTRGA